MKAAHELKMSLLTMGPAVFATLGTFNSARAICASLCHVGLAFSARSMPSRRESNVPRIKPTLVTMNARLWILSRGTWFLGMTLSCHGFSTSL